jgi:hypothetical protein
VRRARFCAAGLAGLVFAAPAGAAVLQAGAGKTYPLPSAAIAAAGAGDTVEIYPGQYFDCATVHAPGVTIEGVGNAADVVITDKACSGKGLLIVDAPDVTVKNLTLTRARVPDGNGAGIRMEGGSLTVDGVRFVNNQDGILTAPDPHWVLTVRNSYFERDGYCGDYCAHGIYAAEIGRVIVDHSKFIRTRDGHSIKSRALATEVTNCTIEDGPDGNSSYAIELPNGGALIARGNHIEKGPKSGNHSAAIVLGSEGVTHPTPEIVVEDNDFTNDMDGHGTVLVNNQTATEAVLRGNVLHGEVRALQGDGSVN